MKAKVNFPPKDKRINLPLFQVLSAKPISRDGLDMGFVLDLGEFADQFTSNVFSETFIELTKDLP